MLSLRVALPNLPIVRPQAQPTISTRLLLPDGLRRLYVAEDNDPAGRRAAASVMTRAEAAGIEAMRIGAGVGRFQRRSAAARARGAPSSLAECSSPPEDVERFWTPGRGECASSVRRVMVADVAGGLGLFPFRQESRAPGPLRGAIGPEPHRAGNGCARLSSPGLPPHAASRAGTPDAPHSSPDQKAVLAVLRCASAAGESSAMQARFVPASSSPTSRGPRPPTPTPPAVDLPQRRAAMTTPPHSRPPPRIPTTTSPPTPRARQPTSSPNCSSMVIVPFEGEPDPRPLPEDHLVRAAIADTFDAFVSALQDTRLEPDLEDLLWGITNVLHRATDRIERELDDNEQAQQRSPSRAGTGPRSARSHWSAFWPKD